MSIIVSKINDQLAFTTPCERRLKDESDDAYLHRIAKTANLTEYFFIEKDAIKGHVAFSDAWVFDGQNVVTDLSKARKMRMNQIRPQRNAKLAELDAKMMFLMEQGTPEEIAALKTEKQRLRDIPQKTDMDQFKTEEELLAFDPVNNPSM